jgi:hypothetical protein
MNRTMIGLNLGVLSWVKGFASKITSLHNTIKIPSDDFLFRLLLTIELLGLNNKSDDDWTGFGRILVCLKASLVKLQDISIETV